MKITNQELIREKTDLFVSFQEFHGLFRLQKFYHLTLLTFEIYKRLKDRNYKPGADLILAISLFLLSLTVLLLIILIDFTRFLNHDEFDIFRFQKGLKGGLKHKQNQQYIIIYIFHKSMIACHDTCIKYIIICNSCMLVIIHACLLFPILLST